MNVHGFSFRKHGKKGSVQSPPGLGHSEQHRQHMRHVSWVCFLRANKRLFQNKASKTMSQLSRTEHAIVVDSPHTPWPTAASRVVPQQCRRREGWHHPPARHTAHCHTQTQTTQLNHYFFQKIRCSDTTMSPTFDILCKIHRANHKKSNSMRMLLT